MDLFPIVLTNRDMNTLMGMIEEDLGVTLPPVLGVEDVSDIDAVKARVSQMSAGEMRTFLSYWIASLDGLYQGVTGYVEGEEKRLVRKDMATLQSIENRIRRPR